MIHRGKMSISSNHERMPCGSSARISKDSESSEDNSRLAVAPQPSAGGSATASTAGAPATAASKAGTVASAPGSTAGIAPNTSCAAASPGTGTWIAPAKLLPGPKSDANLATPISLMASPVSLAVRGPSGRTVLEIGWDQVRKLSVAGVHNGEATLALTTQQGSTHWFLSKGRDLRRLSSWLESVKACSEIPPPRPRETNRSSESTPRSAKRPLPPSLGSAWRLYRPLEKGSHSARFRVNLSLKRGSSALISKLSSIPRASRVQKVLLPLAAMTFLLGTTLGLSTKVHSRLVTSRHVVAAHHHHMSEKALLALIRAEQHGQFLLAPATKPPAPAPPQLADSAPLASHEVFGFVPYWMLPLQSDLHMASYTTIAYFGVDIAPNGQLVQNGAGWEGYESADLASLITRAHHDGVRVVLTAKCFNQSTLNTLTHDPQADKVLAYQLALAIEAKNFDGVNLDLEGTGASDRAGLVELVGTLSKALHKVDPHWQVTMDVYASSASDPEGFFDVARLAPEVNAFFVMAYDMQDPSTPSPTAPLWGTKSFNDFEAVADYIHTVPSTKVILGVPFYGEEWQTSGPQLGAKILSGPLAVTYAQIAAANLPTHWDAVTQTAWTSFRYDGSWYQIDYDNPKSIALKANLAMFFHLRGIGAWALGMQGTNSGMTAALLGKAPPLHDLIKGPPGPLPVPSNPLPSPSGNGWLAPPKASTPIPGSNPNNEKGGSQTSGSCTKEASGQPECLPSGSKPTKPSGQPGQLLASGFWHDQAVSLYQTTGALPGQPNGASSSKATGDLPGRGSGSTPEAGAGSGSTPGAGAGSEATTLTSQVGVLRDFTTNDPAYVCLENLGSLPVWSDPYDANVLLVTPQGPPPGLEPKTRKSVSNQITSSSLLGSENQGDRAGSNTNQVSRQTTHETGSSPTPEVSSSSKTTASCAAGTVWWFAAS